MTDDLADHVLGLGGRGVGVLLPFPADRPLGDIVGPDVGGDAGWSLTEPGHRVEAHLLVEPVAKSSFKTKLHF